jgi:hypothetical protein
LQAGGQAGGRCAPAKLHSDTALRFDAHVPPGEDVFSHQMPALRRMQVLGEVGALPDVFTELEINFFLLRRLLGVRTQVMAWVDV